MTIKDITTAKNFEIEVAAEALNRYGSWEFGPDYEAIQVDEDSGEDKPSFEDFIANANVRIMARDGETSYGIFWGRFKAEEYDPTGDDEETIKNIVEMIAAGEWHDIITYDK